MCVFPSADNLSVSAGQAVLRAESVWGSLRGTVCYWTFQCWILICLFFPSEWLFSINHLKEPDRILLHTHKGNCCCNENTDKPKLLLLLNVPSMKKRQSWTNWGWELSRYTAGYNLFKWHYYIISRNIKLNPVLKTGLESFSQLVYQDDYNSVSKWRYK